MATVQELINRLEYLVDDNVEPKIAVMLFNMAQEDLAEVAGFTKIAEADFYVGAESIQLPPDVVDIEEVIIRPDGRAEHSYRILNAFVHKYEEAPISKTRIQRYELIGDLLYFQPRSPIDGSLRIVYYANLPEIPIRMDYVPKLRTSYHRALPLFAASRYMQNWKDEIDQKQDFFGEYLEIKARLELEHMQRKHQNNAQFVVKVRGWS